MKPILRFFQIKSFFLNPFSVFYDEYGTQIARLTFVAAVLGLLGACSSTSKKSCQTIDWYSAGKSDGAVGQPLSNYLVKRNACVLDEGEKMINAQSLYENGHLAGLMTFCTSLNGWELGRTGGKYLNVCPSYREKDFLKYFELGQQIFGLEKKSVELAGVIRSLHEKLQSGKIKNIERVEISTRIAQLTTDQINLEKKINFLQQSADMNSLLNKTL